MGLKWEQMIVDAHDPGAPGRWWQEALEWVTVNNDPAEYEIRPTPDRLPGLLFVAVPEPPIDGYRREMSGQSGWTVDAARQGR